MEFSSPDIEMLMSGWNTLYKVSHTKLSSELGEHTYFRMLSERSVGSRPAIFHVKTMIRPQDLFRIFRIEFNQGHFLAAVATEISKENSNSMCKVDKKELIMLSREIAQLLDELPAYETPPDDLEDRQPERRYKPQRNEKSPPSEHRNGG
jgi:hypothetical protein